MPYNTYNAMGNNEYGVMSDAEREAQRQNDLLRMQKMMGASQRAPAGGGSAQDYVLRQALQAAQPRDSGIDFTPMQKTALAREEFMRRIGREVTPYGSQQSADAKSAALRRDLGDQQAQMQLDLQSSVGNAIREGLRQQAAPAALAPDPKLGTPGKRTVTMPGPGGGTITADVENDQPLPAGVTEKPRAESFLTPDFLRAITGKMLGVAPPQDPSGTLTQRILEAMAQDAIGRGDYGGALDAAQGRRPASREPELITADTLGEDLKANAASFGERDASTFGWDPNAEDVQDILRQRNELVASFMRRDPRITREQAMSAANRLIRQGVSTYKNDANSGWIADLLKRLDQPGG